MTFRDTTIVFNGEIFNFLEVRKTLQALGWAFETAGDTEVLLKALMEWGRGALKRVRGMYAFLLWRAGQQELWAARDPYGIKPLFWAKTPGGGACFASEVRALTELVPSTVSSRAISEFLHFGSPYSVTAFEGITEVPPGALAIWSGDGGIAVETQTTEPLAANNSSTPELFGRVIGDHLRSDRPTALFLSGGFDSALIASIAARTANPPTGITVDTGSNQSDVDGARRTAEHYGLDLRVVSYRPEEIATSIIAYLLCMDQPTVDGLNTYLVSNAANMAGFPVALSGLGGDELLGGYGYYRRARWMARAGLPYRYVPQRAKTRIDELIASRTGRQPSQVRSILGSRNPLDRYHAWRCVFTPEETERLTGSRPASTTLAVDGLGMDSRAEFMTLDFQLYLRSTLLRDTDIFSMACGLEVRVPFLDELLVTHITTRMPGATKPELAIALSDDYLAQIATRRKIPFRVPWNDWISTLVSADNPLGDADPWHGLIDPAEARAIVPLGSRSSGDRLLALVMLARWLDGLSTARRIQKRPL